MRQVSVIIHLDLADSWAGLDRTLERYVLDAVRPALADAVAVDAEVWPEPERPAEVPWPEDVPAPVKLDENTPNALRPSLHRGGGAHVCSCGRRVR